MRKMHKNPRMTRLERLPVFARGERRRSGGGSVTQYTPVRVTVPVGNIGASGELDLYVPNKRKFSRAVSDPQTLFHHVQGVWGAVVEENQAGLLDAKHQAAASMPLTAHEAWHHYTAGQRGIIDSARFLIAFSVVPSIQSGGSALHTAAAHNNVIAIDQLVSASTESVAVDAKSTQMAPRLCSHQWRWSQKAQANFCLRCKRKSCCKKRCFSLDGRAFDTLKLLKFYEGRGWLRLRPAFMR